MARDHLTKSEELDLISQAQDVTSDEAGALRARDELFDVNFAAIESLSKKVGRQYGVESNSLITAGFEGLAQAIKNFDPDIGARLFTYAQKFIVWNMRKAAKADLSHASLVNENIEAPGEMMAPSSLDLSVLSDAQRDIFEKVCLGKMTCADYAGQANLDNNYIRFQIESIKAVLYDNIEVEEVQELKEEIVKFPTGAYLSREDIPFFTRARHIADQSSPEYSEVSPYEFVLKSVNGEAFLNALVEENARLNAEHNLVLRRETQMKKFAIAPLMRALVRHHPAMTTKGLCDVAQRVLKAPVDFHDDIASIARNVRMDGGLGRDWDGKDTIYGWYKVREERNRVLALNNDRDREKILYPKAYL